MKSHVNRPIKHEYINYRSYKNFDVTNFNEDISKIYVPTSKNLSSKEQLNNMYENYESEFLKTRKPRNKPLSCMNSELRSAMHKKHMLYSHFTKNKNAKTWDKYRRQRNLVTKLKKKSMKNYFLERCTGGCKNSNFWSTMKPFFSKKCYGGEQKIVLCEDDKIVNNTKDVTECFNNFFSTVANSIGKDGKNQAVSANTSYMKIKCIDYC